ncbi:MAG: hypothetical protein R3F24_05610 [Gammaproteobacteria bacterium]
MEDALIQASYDFLARLTGPLKFRFVLQPLMALILATLAGLKDAREGKPAYFWALLTDPAHRRAMLRDGWKSIGKLFVVALLLDLGYQFYVLHVVHPVGAVIVAIILAIVPYLLVRGSVTRVAGVLSKRKSRS